MAICRPDLPDDRRIAHDWNIHSWRVARPCHDPRAGEPCLEHDERYRRSEEFIRTLRGIWTQGRHDRRVQFGLNGFVIVRDTEIEARETLREIIAKADRPAVEGFRDAVTQAEASTADRKGMWANSSFDDLVQYKDGFRSQLISTVRDHRTVTGGFR